MIRAISIYIILVCTFLVPDVYAQNRPGKIEVLGRAGEQNIKLRWAPNNSVAWERLNKYGYHIERVTISRDGSILQPPVKKKLNMVPIKPRPLSEWEEIVKVNDYGAVAAQALYGETFELSENYSSDIIQIVQKSKEIEQRFSFALFAADQSFEVADMSGLAFIDHTAQKNEKYLYRIRSAVPQEIETIDSAFVYLGLKDYEELPAIYDVQVMFNDRSVMISWERQNFEGIYNSFIVEKSVDDNKTFKSITVQPIVNTSASEKSNTRRAYKLDSLEENGKMVSYRVRGVNAFGELSPPSDTISGYGLIRLNAAPNIINWNTNNVTTDIHWEYSNRNAINGFKIERSNKIDGPYNEIAKVGVDVNQFKDTQPIATNYYRVVAYNERHNAPSFPVLVQLEDSIPPAVPSGLTGNIDTTGIVKLTWKANEEQDLLGYRIFCSNFRNSEFSQITSGPIITNEWSDYLELDNLASKIYYKVLAVDQRYNPSEESDILELHKPDLIPPVAPVIINVKSEDNGIEIRWIRSSSKDVVVHHLYRRQQNTNNWSLIQSFNNNEASFLDSTIHSSLPYQYTIIAVDRSKLESKPVTPVWAKVISSGLKPAIGKIKITIDREAKSIKLRWDYKGSSDLENYIIYRATPEEALTLYKTVQPDIKGYEDKDINTKGTYTYRVKAVYDDGLESAFSKETVVQY